MGRITNATRATDDYMEIRDALERKDGRFQLKNDLEGYGFDERVVDFHTNNVDEDDDSETARYKFREFLDRINDGSYLTFVYT